MISGARASAATTTISSRDGALGIKTNNDPELPPPRSQRRPPTKFIGDDLLSRPSAAMALSGFSVSENFHLIAILLWMHFAHDIATVMQEILLITSILDKTMVSLTSDSWNLSIARIVWNRKLRKPPDESAEQHWLRKPPNIYNRKYRLLNPPGWEHRYPAQRNMRIESSGKARSCTHGNLEFRDTSFQFTFNN